MARSPTKIKLSVDPMLDAEDLDAVEIEDLLQRNFEDHGDWMHEAEERNEAVLRNMSLAIARSTIKNPTMFNKMEDDEDVEDVTMYLTDLFQEAALSSPKGEIDGKSAAIKPKEEGWMNVVDKRIRQWVSSAEQKLKEEVSDLATKYQLLRV